MAVATLSTSDPALIADGNFHDVVLNMAAATPGSRQSAVADTLIFRARTQRIVAAAMLAEVAGPGVPGEAVAALVVPGVLLPEDVRAVALELWGIDSDSGDSSSGSPPRVFREVPAAPAAVAQEEVRQLRQQLQGVPESQGRGGGAGVGPGVPEPAAPVWALPTVLAWAPPPPIDPPPTPWRLSVVPTGLPFSAHLATLRQRQLPVGVTGDSNDLSFIAVGYEREHHSYRAVFRNMLPGPVTALFGQILQNFQEYDAARFPDGGARFSWEKKIALEFLTLTAAGTLIQGVLVTYVPASALRRFCPVSAQPFC